MHSHAGMSAPTCSLEQTTCQGQTLHVVAVGVQNMRTVAGYESAFDVMYAQAAEVGGTAPHAFRYDK